MQSAVIGGVAAWNRWLLTFSVTAVAILIAGTIARDYARRVADAKNRGKGQRGGVRRRAGGLLALGPLVGLAFAPSFGALALVIVLVGTALAVFGMVIERSAHADGLALAAVV